jgi:hypothetical protein
LTLATGGPVARVNLDAAFADFLRLRVAEGDLNLRGPILLSELV